MRQCITKPTVWSDIIIKHPLTIIKGENVSDGEHLLLMVDIGITNN